MAVLDVHNLKKTYATPDGEQHTVIDVAAFSMDEGAQVALRGTSGSGKTTFLNLIAGILRPDSGSINLAGAELTKLSESGRDALRARHLGYVFQTFNLLQGYTALENVLLGMMFGPGKDVDLAKSLLERVGIADRMHYRPRQLSVGQQQRVAVARALANKPDLVLADEPTGNLDPQHSANALGLIRELCTENGAALLLVSHDQAILSQFDSSHDLAEINRTSTSSAGV